jgi:spore germination cell wall hydrolase CwlJ-like protein
MKGAILGIPAAKMLAFAITLAMAGAGIPVAVAALRPAPLPPPSFVRIDLKPLAFTPALIQPAAVAETDDTRQALKSLLAEHHCLAQVMYYEARGEGEEGEKAVAEVVFHRLAEGDHGGTLCAVIYEGAGETFCQFTFACDGSLKRPRDPVAWRAAEMLAAQLMAGELIAPDDVDGATFYHAASVHPGWAPKLEKVAQIGHHIFYRALETADSLRASLR